LGASFWKDTPVPKLKTHKAAAKRFKITGTGRIMRPKAWGNKKRLAKSARTKRMYAHFFEVAEKGVVKRIEKMLPYGVQ
jgi:large subunit ribosomal protein L35